jgi:multidrug efflux pump subunit AcrB
VVSVDVGTPMKGMSQGVHLSVKTEKETIAAHLGPRWYLENQDIKFAPKDTVEVKGSRVTIAGKPALLAAEVKKGDYRRLMRPLLRDWRQRWLFFGLVILMLGAAGSLVVFRVVRVKMLPFDNKSELQIIVDMPEGTTLEETARVTRDLSDALAADPDVTNLQAYVGTAAPYNFNGLIRHYFPPTRGSALV